MNALILESAQLLFLYETFIYTQTKLLHGINLYTISRLVIILFRHNIYQRYRLCTVGVMELTHRRQKKQDFWTQFKKSTHAFAY